MVSAKYFGKINFDYLSIGMPGKFGYSWISMEWPPGNAYGLLQTPPTQTYGGPLCTTL